MAVSEDVFSTWQDDRICEDVNRAIARQPEIQFLDIGVDVCAANVLLSGFVYTSLEKMIAEGTAKRVYGVRAVTNVLVVRPPGHRSEQQIARDVIRRLSDC